MTLRPNRIRAVIAHLPGPVLHPDGRLVLTLPLPTREVSPNASRSHSRRGAIIKSQKVKLHKTRARLAMVDAIARYGTLGPFTGYSLAFHFPTAAYRDDDNADASFKPYRDGIADALHINDRHLTKAALSTRAKDPITPRLEITLHP